MKYSTDLLTITIVSVLAVLALSNSLTFGQVLLLPAPTQFVRGDGECSDLVIGIHNEHWRVRKGDVFAVLAVQPLVQESDLNYVWKVSNGKIVSGQRTSKVEVKAGGAKTPGYVNVTGFVRVTLMIERIRNSKKCMVEAIASIMVGRHREVNGTPRC